MTLFLFCCVALFLGGCQEETATAPVVKSDPIYSGTIVAVGDSLTAGLGVAEDLSYPAVLQRKLQSNGHNYRVINAGVSGETTSGTVSRLEWIMTMKPDIVIIEIGANDGLRGIDVKVPQENLKKIIEFFRERQVITVFTGMQMVWNLGPEYTTSFNAIYPELAGKYDLIFMPFFLADVATVQHLNSEDGIHPNEEGYERIVDNLYPHVVKAVERHESMAN